MDSLRADATPIPLRWIVTAAGASVVALAMLLADTGLSIALNGAALAFVVAGLILLAIRGLCRQSRPSTSDAAENALLFIFIALTGAVASYGVAALTHGWVDADMERFDRAIGFDWNWLYALTAAHGWMQIGGRLVYASIFASPVILVLSFAIHDRRAAARSFLASFWLAAMVCLVLFRWLPTLGPLAFMWDGPIDYMPTSGLYQADLIPLLREGRADSIDLGALRGLVGPPSFHAASAVLYTLAADRAQRADAAVHSGRGHALCHRRRKRHDRRDPELGRGPVDRARSNGQDGGATAMSDITIWTLDWVPEGPRGFVRDLRLRWACEEAGLAYRVRTVPFEDRASNHLDRQPFGQVPYLDDSGLQIFESGAGLLHLAGKSDLLMPTDPSGAAATLQWTVAALNSVEMVSVPWWFLRMSGDADNKLTGWLTQRLDHVERELAQRQQDGREWLAAGRFTVADLLMADVLRVPAVREFGDRPASEAYVARVTDRPAFRKALADQLALFAKGDAARGG